MDMNWIPFLFSVKTRNKEERWGFVERGSSRTPVPPVRQDTVLSLLSEWRDCGVLRNGKRLGGHQR